MANEGSNTKKKPSSRTARRASSVKRLPPSRSPTATRSRTSGSTSKSVATMAGQVTQIMDRQIARGARIIGQLAHSTTQAADDLNHDAPHVAEVVRTFGSRMEDYADDLHGQSTDQLLRSASDLSRRQPALVFGLAALAGFFIFRTLKSAERSPD